MDYYHIVKKKVIQDFNDFEINDIQIVSVYILFFLLIVNFFNDHQN